jgi:hypothetical protein
MVLALPIAVAIVSAYVWGGRLGRLATARFRWVELFYVAIGIQIVAFPASFLPWETSDGLGRVLWLTSYAVLCVAALLNVRVTGVPVVAVGMLSNMAAVLANGGHMPALPGALRAAGEASGIHFNSAEMASPHVSWLADRWAAPDWLPWANVFSVGDVVIAVGVIVIVFAASGARVTSPLPGRSATGGIVPRAARRG